MKITAPALLLVLTLLALAGCAAKKSPPPAQNFSAVPGLTPGTPVTPAQNQPLTVTPEAGSQAKVLAVDNSARFVVVSFPPGYQPAQEHRFYVYRHGLKVGEIKVNGPQINQNVVADLTDGEAQAGDDVREK